MNTYQPIFEYDSNGRLIRHRGIDGCEEWYDSNGKLIYYRSDNGREYRYDSDGNVIGKPIDTGLPAAVSKDKNTMSNEVLRLPCGNLTTDVDAYIHAWKSLANVIEDALDAQVYAFNPDLGVRDKEGLAGFSLPMWAAQKIVTLVNQRDEAQRTVMSWSKDCKERQ
jgi:YD repeat-containing protein